MKAVQRYVLLLGALGLSACGMFQTPTKPTSPTTETIPSPEFEAQGTPTVCTNQSAGGNFPYNSNGPLWRQQFFLNDNGTPLNYSTFSTDLPAVGNISMNPYVVNATGGTYTPGPWMYQHIYAPNVILTGTQTNGAAANNIVVTASGNYGLSYNASLKQFDLPVVSSSNKFKLYDAAGNLLPTEYGGSQTSMPSINGRVRIPTGQKVTLEFYLDPKVQYRPELIWANFKDASGVSKTDWVKVTMPYQEGILKVNAATYTVQESTGIKTYQSATNPLPKFKFVMRGYNNLVSADRQFMNRQGIYYAWPSSVPSGNWTAYNQFMDERKDFVLNWNLYDQKVGSASVDASGDPVLNAATVSTAAQWNLGTPGYANDKNCISKTVEFNGNQFTVKQPLAYNLLDSSDPRIARLEVEPKNAVVAVGARPKLTIKAFDVNGIELGLLNPKEVVFSLVGRTDALPIDRTDGLIFSGLNTVDSYHLRFTTLDQPTLVAYSYLSSVKLAAGVKILSRSQVVFPKANIKSESITPSNLDALTAPFSSSEYGALLSSLLQSSEIPVVLQNTVLQTGDRIFIADENIAGEITRIVATKGNAILVVLKPNFVPQDTFSEYKPLIVNALPLDDPDLEVDSIVISPASAGLVSQQGISKQGFIPSGDKCKGTMASLLDMRLETQFDLVGLANLVNKSPDPAMITGKIKWGIVATPSKGGGFTCEWDIIKPKPFLIPGPAGTFLHGEIKETLKVGGEITASAAALGFTITANAQVDLKDVSSERTKATWGLQPIMAGAGGDFYSINGPFVRGGTKVEAVLETNIDLVALNQVWSQVIKAYAIAWGMKPVDYLKIATMRIGPALSFGGQALSMNAVYNTGESSQISASAGFKGSFLKDLKWVDLLDRAGIKLPIEFYIKLFELKTQTAKIESSSVSPDPAENNTANIQLIWKADHEINPLINSVQLGSKPVNSLHARRLTQLGGEVDFDLDKCLLEGSLKSNIYASGPLYIYENIIGTDLKLDIDLPFNPSSEIIINCARPINKQYYVGKITLINGSSRSSGNPGELCWDRLKYNLSTERYSSIQNATTGTFDLGDRDFYWSAVQNPACPWMEALKAQESWFNSLYDVIKNDWLSKLKSEYSSRFIGFTLGEFKGGERKIFANFK